jgi:hypothetical protein
MMRRFPVLCIATLAVVGCAKSDEAATDTAAGGTATATAAPAAATLNLSDVAGRWNVRTVPESGTDTTATNYVLTATADTTGWTMTFPGRPRSVPLRIAVAGDSIMFRSEPFQSVRRRGVQVWTEGVGRVQGGRLVGTATAHYKTTGADSVLRLRMEGTRAP